MKRRTKILALIAVMALFAGIAAGCTDSSSDQDSDEETSPSASFSDTETAQTTEAIAEVVSVNESNLEVRFYTANSEDAADLADYTAVNLDDYTASLDAETLTVSDSAEILAVREGELADAALEDVEAGAVIAVTYADQEAQKIVILEVSQEQKTLVAEVTAISEDGQLSLTRYALTSDAAETDLIDYANVDLALYEATEETDEYTIATRRRSMWPRMEL